MPDIDRQEPFSALQPPSAQRPLDTQQPRRREDETDGGGNDTLRAASSRAADIRDDVAAAAEAQKNRAADSAQHASDAARDAATKLQGENAWMAGLVERAADGLAGFADILRGNDLQAVLAHAQGYARRQPVLFAGAAFAAGFALTRAARAGVSQNAGAAGSQNAGAGGSQNAGPGGSP